jgi:hypothetical protein
MARTFTIPACVMLDVRGALIAHMGGSLEALDEAITRPEHEHHPEWFAEGRQGLEHIWAFLDLIGWGGSGEDQDTEFDLDAFGLVLQEAVSDLVPLYDTWEEEADKSDAWRAERGIPPRKEDILRRGAALRALSGQLDALLPDSD